MCRWRKARPQSATREEPGWAGPSARQTRPRIPAATRGALEIDWFRSWLAIDGKANLETGFTGVRFKFNFTAMTVADDAVADHEAKARAGPNGFRREKRLEHVRLDLGRNAWAVIDDFYHQLIIFARSANANLAGAIYGGDRVID